MATVLDSISGALTELGVLAAGETPTAVDASDALVAFNNLIDQWKAENLSIFTVKRTTFTITSGTQTYQVGTGAGSVVLIEPPAFIDAVSFSDSSTSPATEYPMRSLTDAEFEAIRIRTLTSPLPQAYYYNRSLAAVSGALAATLTLFPVPTSTTLTGVLYSPQPVAEFANLTDVILLPPGFKRMILKNLALEMAPSYSRQADPLLFKQAQDAVAVVKRSNSKLIDIQFSAEALVGGGGGAWSIYTGP